MAMRLLALSAFLLPMAAAASAAAQPSCGDAPRTVIEYVGFSLDGAAEDERAELASAVGQLVARFGLQCGYHLTLHVTRRSGGYEVAPRVASLTDACRFSIRVREDGRFRSAGGRHLPDAIIEAAELGIETRRRDCRDP
ncbi:hypothetical protein M0Q28_03680 [Patescibacteria group bacterium]|jgi:hypothetical protein|nr:hypothetical protein [Patescibacteria group bacterium]